MGVSLAVLAAAAPFGSAASAATPAPRGELVVNGGLDQGTTGWRTNGPDQMLSSIATGHTGAAAEVVAAKPGTVVLNDDAATVGSTDQGQKYAVSAWVKADAPVPISGQLRVREVSGSNVITHGTSFYLAGTGWQQVRLDFATAASGASLDLNVLAWNLAANSGLQIDELSMKAASSPVGSAPALAPVASPAPSPLKAPSPAPASPAPSPSKAPSPSVSPAAPAPARAPAASVAGISQRGIPTSGALVGAAVGSNTDPSSVEKSMGAKLQVRRTYWGGGSVTSAVNTARTDIAAGRIPWESFKLPYSWSDMAAGKGDAWVKNLASQLGSLNGPVWIAFHHEPEGDGDISQWVAMQKHLAPIIHNNTKNVAYTMIMTGWHEIYGGPQYALDKLWPGDGLVDMLGFDIYNNYGVTRAGKTNSKTTEFATSYYPQFSAFAKKHNVAWGVAETGITDQGAAADPTWLNRSYTDMVKYGGSALTYFDSSLHSAGSWEITTPLKRNEFGSILKKAISAR